ncbi:MAG: LpxD N-terminal domain-containing protein, partial [Planctomycetota bacterium]
MSTTTQALADALGVELRGNPDLPLTGVNTIDAAGPSELTFLANRRYLAQLGTTDAGAVVLSPADADNAADAANGRAMLVAD